MKTILKKTVVDTGTSLEIEFPEYSTGPREYLIQVRVDDFTPADTITSQSVDVSFGNFNASLKILTGAGLMSVPVIWEPGTNDTGFYVSTSVNLDVGDTITYTLFLCER